MRIFCEYIAKKTILHYLSATDTNLATVLIWHIDDGKLSGGHALECAIAFYDIMPLLLGVAEHAFLKLRRVAYLKEYGKGSITYGGQLMPPLKRKLAGVA